MIYIVLPPVRAVLKAVVATLDCDCGCDCDLHLGVGSRSPLGNGPKCGIVEIESTTLLSFANVKGG